MKRRLLILFYFIIGKRNGLTVKNLIKFILSARSRIIAKNYIKTVEIKADCTIVNFFKYDNNFILPKNYAMDSFYNVVTESMYSSHFHYYEIEGTQLNTNDIVIDCGAAEGFFTFKAANVCKRVYAIEPNPTFVNSMSTMFNYFSNVEVMHFALSDKEETKYITNNGIYSVITDENTNIPVSLTTLDKLFYEKNIPITYIKADLEGYEMKMLSGAKYLIAKNKPKIAITTYHRKDHAEEIMSYLKGIDNEYKFKIKGIEHRFGAPVMLHAWV